jgi:hypothetical protein
METACLWQQTGINTLIQYIVVYRELWIGTLILCQCIEVLGSAPYRESLQPVGYDRNLV